MALFQKNPYDTREHQTLFTIGSHKTVLLVGLGNPGKKYEGSRHNIGFACLDGFAKALEFDKWIEKKDLKCHLSSKTLGDTRVILCKPTTYMNLSGEAVSKVLQFYKLNSQQVVAVYDELAIPFGQIRMRIGGSDAGHNGVKSLISHIEAGFGRVRIGIDGDKPDKMDDADYVLAKFTKEEQAQISNLSRETTSILTEYIYRGELLPETRSFIV